MKFIIQQGPLLDALEKLQNLVDKKNLMAVLGNVLCQVEGDFLQLIASNLQVGLRVVLPLEKGISGQTTVNLKKFLEIVKALPSQVLSFSSQENHWIEIVSGKAKFQLGGLSPETYPSLPPFLPRPRRKIYPSVLRRMLEQTLFAASEEPSKGPLNGIFFQLEGEIFQMTAMDGHRLSISRGVPLKLETELEASSFKRGLLIPLKGGSELKKLLECLSSEEDEIGFEIERGYLFLEIGRDSFFMRLLEGEYPEYSEVLPFAQEPPLRLPKEILLGAIARVGILAHEKSKGILLKASPQKMVLQSSSSESGEATEELDLEESYAGKEWEKGVNSSYLSEGLSVLTAPQVELFNHTKTGALFFREGEQYRYLVMPMKV